jgi:segregation and condensation protein A
MKLLVGQGMNNFIVEWNDHREEDLLAEGLTDEGDLTEAPITE